MMTLRLRCIDTLVDVPRDAWNALAASQGYYSSYDWLLSQEALPAATACYVIAESESGDLLGAVPVYKVSAENSARYSPALLNLGPADASFVVLGARRGYRSGPLLRGDRGGAPRAEVLRLLGEGVRDVSPGRAGWYFVADADLGDVRRVCPGPVSVTSLDRDWWLDVPLDGLKAFIDAQPSKRRRMMRNERGRFLQAGYEVAVETPDTVIDEAGPLLAQLEQRYGKEKSNPEAMTRYLRRITSVADPGEVVTCRLDGRLVGFSQYFVFGQTVWGRTTGYDYSSLKGEFEYFNICYYELIERAAALGCTAVHLGIGSPEAKANRGARMEELWGITVQG